MAKTRTPSPRRRKTNNIVPMPTVELVARPSTPDEPTGVDDSDVARRAFELYCERGGQHGHDLEDWLQAERELRGAAAVAVA